MSKKFPSTAARISAYSPLSANRLVQVAVEDVVHVLETLAGKCGHVVSHRQGEFEDVVLQ
jgi:hypothetical protein